MKVAHCDKCKKKASMSIKTMVDGTIIGSDATCDMDPYARAIWGHKFFEIDLCNECIKPMVETYLKDLYKSCPKSNIFKQGVFSDG